MYWSSAGGAKQQRVAAQRNSVQAAAAGRPLRLRDATLGSPIPGGPAYGARLNNRQVLVQRGAAGSGAMAGGAINFGGQTLYPARSGDDVIWMPARASSPSALEQQLGGIRPSGAGADPASGAGTLSPAPPSSRPPAVLSDDADARASERRRMQQQYAPQNYWATETGKVLAEAAKTGPRSTDPGYAQRADIVAWMEANKNAPKGADGKNIVDRFLEQQRAKGLLDAPGGGGVAAPGGEQLRTPTDSESAAQALARGVSWADPALKGQTPMAVAQADIAAYQGRQNEALTAAAFNSQAFAERYGAGGGLDPATAAAFQSGGELDMDPALAFRPEFQGALAIARRPMEAEQVRQSAMASVAPAHDTQTIATGTGAGMPALQPTSALAGEAGVEPAQPDAPGNRPNPADELVRGHLNKLRNRAAVLGY